MKRNIELSRKLLMAMEESDSSLPTNALTAQYNQPEEVLAYHVLLLEEAGLLTAAILPESRRTHPHAAVMHRLTHTGHELLDTIRSEGAWEKLKEYVTEKGLEVTVGTLIKAIPGFIAAALGG